MRILFIVPYTPNPIRVRSYEFVRAMLRRGHAVTLATLWTSPSEQDDLNRLAQMGAHVLAESMPSWRSALNSLAALPASTPLQAVYSWQPDLFGAVLALVQEQQFDAIHVEHLRGSRYGLELLASRQSGALRAPIVWDSVDCISHLFAQAAAQSRSTKGKLMTRFELPRTQRYEARLVRTFDHTVVTSSIDRAALLELAGSTGCKTACLRACQAIAPNGMSRRTVDVVPNGVDLEHFAFCGPEQRHANRIVFSGKMSYHANVTAALHLVDDIMPLVWAQRPDAELWLVGKDPVPELRALAEKSHAGGTRVAASSSPAKYLPCRTTYSPPHSPLPRCCMAPAFRIRCWRRWPAARPSWQALRRANRSLPGRARTSWWLPTPLSLPLLSWLCWTRPICAASWGVPAAALSRQIIPGTVQLPISNAFMLAVLLNSQRNR